MAIRALIIIVIILFGNSCGKKTRSNEKIGLKKVYSELTIVEEIQEKNREEEKLITISASEMPFKDFMRLLVDTSGVSLVVQDNLDNRLITLDVDKKPVSHVIALVARRLGVSATGADGLYYVGTIRAEDKAFFVKRVSRLSKQELTSAVSVLLSENGRVTVRNDGLVVAADTVEVINRIVALVEQIEKAPADSWVLQLHIIAISKSDMSQLGINFDHLGQAAFNITKTNSNSSQRNTTGSLALNATLNAIREKQNSDIVAQPLMLLVDGETGRIHQGERTPIRKTNITDQGTVTTIGFDYISTGLQIKSTIRTASNTHAQVQLEVELSQITGFVANEAPIITTSSMDTVSYIQSGGTYLLGSLKSKQIDSTRNGPYIITDFKNSKSEKDLQVWGVVYRVASPLNDLNID